jgi:hypothetical protein
MCITTLNLSTLPCAHRYYALQTPCGPNSSLATCSKVQLTGWERRTSSCPLCLPDPGSNSETHRILNETSTPISSRRVSISTAPHSRRTSALHSDPATYEAFVNGEDVHELALRAEGRRNRRLSAKIEAVLPADLKESWRNPTPPTPVTTHPRPVPRHLPSTLDAGTGEKHRLDSGGADSGSSNASSLAMTSVGSSDGYEEVAGGDTRSSSSRGVRGMGQRVSGGFRRLNCGLGG